MSVIQSFQLPTEPSYIEELEASTHSNTIDKAALKVMLAKLDQSDLFELLMDVDKDLLKAERVALENKLTVKYEQALNEKLALSVEKIKEEVKLEEAKRQKQLKDIIEQFEAPEISKNIDINEQATLIACQIAEKIISQKITDVECYQQWADQLISSTYGHHFPILHISQQDYDQLEQYELLDIVKDKIDSIAIKDVPRFSFQLHSDNGISGHDSLAVIKKIESLLMENS